MKGFLLNNCNSFELHQEIFSPGSCAQSSGKFLQKYGVLLATVVRHFLIASLMEQHWFLL